MKSISFVLFFVFIALNQGCSNSDRSKKENTSLAQSNLNYHKINFYSFIDEEKNDTLKDSYEELLYNKAFVNILEHGEFYIDDVILFLNKRNFNDMQVAVCIGAMQNLKVSDYVKPCNLILELYNSNKLPEGILEHAISPDFLRKRIIIDNYADPEVVKLLRNIENNNKVTNTDFKNYLPEILSGKSSKELKEFDQQANQ